MKWYQIRNDAGALQIEIGNDIGTDANAETFLNEMASIGEYTSISLVIDSCGGDTKTGFRVCEWLEAQSVPVVAHVKTALSMGACIALAAKEIFIARDAWFMIHNSWTPEVTGTAQDIQIAADWLRQVDEKIFSLAKKFWSVSDEEIREAMQNEHWFHGEEMPAAGWNVSIENPALSVAMLQPAAMRVFAKVPAEYAAQKQQEAITARAAIDTARAEAQAAKAEAEKAKEEVITARAEAQAAKAEAEKAKEKIVTALTPGVRDMRCKDDVPKNWKQAVTEYGYAVAKVKFPALHASVLKGN